MKSNIIVGISCMLLAALLAFLSFKGKINSKWLKALNDTIGIVSLIVSVVALINPWADKEEKNNINRAALDNKTQIIIGDSSGGNVIGQTGEGSVSINTGTIIGDTSTSAEKRAESAFEQIKDELLTNFSNLAILINTIEKRPPRTFWDIRRTNESELAYQDRAANEFRDYQKEINSYIAQTLFSNNVYRSFKHDLSHNNDWVRYIEKAFNQQNEVTTSFSRFETALHHVLSLKLNDIERNSKSGSLHKESLANAKMALLQAVANFCLVASRQEIRIMSDAIDLAGIKFQFQPGNDGYKQAMDLASRFAQEKATILEKRLKEQTIASKREINRRIQDPYLVMLRKATGLPPTLTESEVFSLQNKKLNTTETDPVELFKLAANAYMESDGDASAFYFQNALTKKLSQLQSNFARLSIDRIEHPEKYEGSMGVMVAKLTPGENFEKSGLLSGDVVVSVNGDLANDPMGIASALARSQEPVLLKIKRKNQQMIIKAKQGEPAGAVLTTLILFNAIQL